jgi:hypothetical protein
MQRTLVRRSFLRIAILQHSVRLNLRGCSDLSRIPQDGAPAPRVLLLRSYLRRDDRE